MNKDKILEYLGWLGLAVAAVWVILKAVGVIHSPDWVKMVPYAGIIFWAGVAYQKIITLSKDLSEVKFDINILKKDFHSIDKRLTLVEVKTH